MDEETKQKQISITQVTVPLVLIAGFFGASVVWGMNQYWGKEKLTMEIALSAQIEANNDSIAEQIKNLDTKVTLLASATTDGRFSNKHYRSLRLWVYDHPNAPWPDYESLREMTLSRD